MTQVSRGIATITCDNCGNFETVRDCIPYTINNWVKVFARDRRGNYTQGDVCPNCDTSTILLDKWASNEIAATQQAPKLSDFFNIFKG